MLLLPASCCKTYDAAAGRRAGATLHVPRTSARKFPSGPVAMPVGHITDHHLHSNSGRGAGRGQLYHVPMQLGQGLIVAGWGWVVVASEPQYLALL